MALRVTILGPCCQHFRRTAGHRIPLEIKAVVNLVANPFETSAGDIFGLVRLLDSSLAFDKTSG